MKALLLAGTALLVLPLGRAEADDDIAVGLYDPDLRAMRRLIGPRGIPTLPSGRGLQEIAGAWNAISSQGRDLLLRERDLAIVVIDSKGNWLYRSSGVYTLRVLYPKIDDRKREDLVGLLRILQNDWFQKLREFFGQTLFARGAAPDAARLGQLLMSVDQLADAKPAQKNWFRGIVGGEIHAMDNAARTALLLDQKYGREFVNAVSLAERERNRQLESIAEMLSTHPKYTITLADTTLWNPKQKNATKWNTSGPGDFNIRIVNGKSVWAYPSESGTVYVTSRGKDMDSHRLAQVGHLTSDQLYRWIDDKKVHVFLGVPGKTDVYELGAKKKLAD